MSAFTRFHLSDQNCHFTYCRWQRNFIQTFMYWQVRLFKCFFALLLVPVIISLYCFNVSKYNSLLKLDQLNMITGGTTVFKQTPFFFSCYYFSLRLSVTWAKDH